MSNGSTGLMLEATTACVGLRPRWVEFPGYLSKVATGTTAFFLRRRLSVVYDDVPAELPALETRASSGKGLGLFARNDIPAFTCILADDSLLSLALGEDLPDLWTRYKLLTREEQSIFDALDFPPEREAQEPALRSKLVARGYDAPTSASVARVASRFHANAFKNGPLPRPPLALLNAAAGDLAHTPRELQDMYGNASWAFSVFPKIARINHSCTPNAHAHYRAASGQQVLFSLREIHAGEELHIAYFDLTLPREARLQAAQRWGFVCGCDACAEVPNPEGALGPSAPEYKGLLAQVHECACINLPSLISQPSPLSSARIDQLSGMLERATAIAKAHQWPWLSAALPKLLEISSFLGQSHDMEGMTAQEYCHWERKLHGRTFDRYGLPHT